MKGKNKTSETIVAYVLQIKVLHCSTQFRNGLGQRIYIYNIFAAKLDNGDTSGQRSFCQASFPW